MTASLETMNGKLMPGKNRSLTGGAAKIGHAAGFSIVELMTVVAVIGILAAIAIPQFQSYRRQAFDAAALSDIKNLFNSQHSLFTSAKSYGWTASSKPYNCTGKNVNYVSSGAGNCLLVGCASSSATTSPDSTPISLSNGVVIAADIDKPTGPGASYVAIAKHSQGDICFAIDGDASLIYRNSDPTKCGPGMNIGTAPAIGLDDFAGQQQGKDDIQGKPGWEAQ